MNSFWLTCTAFRKGIFKLLYCTDCIVQITKSSRTDFKNDIRCLRPVLDLTARLVILDDFNIQIDCVNAEFVEFMKTLFSCVQQIKQSTTDSGSVLDLIFANCQAFCDVEVHWTDHKHILCHRYIDVQMMW